MTEYVSDLQSLVQQWGNKFSQHHSTSCVWVDLYAERHEMAQYKQYKISASVQNMHYGSSGTTTSLPGYVFTDTTFNNSEVTQKSTFKQTKSVTNSFTWSMTATIGINIKLTFNVGVPAVASGTTEMSMNMSISSTQSQTESETRTWEIDREVTTPPKSKIVMVWTINEKESSAIFYADVVITGYVAIWNKVKIDINNPGGSDKHWLWFIPVDQVFREMQSYGISVPSQYSIGWGSVTYKASGLCKGKSGFNTTFTVTQYPPPDLKSGPKVAVPSKDLEENVQRRITEIGVPAKE